MKYLLLLLIIILTSCEEKNKYPNYQLTTINYIPDSLKNQHAEYIKELVRASNQHLSARDYKDINKTIIQAEHTANTIFGIKTIGLRKCINDNYWDCFELKKDELNEKELIILDSLMSK